MNSHDDFNTFLLKELENLKAGWQAVFDELEAGKPAPQSLRVGLKPSGDWLQD